MHRDAGGTRALRRRGPRRHDATAAVLFDDGAPPVDRSCLLRASGLPGQTRWRGSNMAGGMATSGRTTRRTRTRVKRATRTRAHHGRLTWGDEHKTRINVARRIVAGTRAWQSMLHSAEKTIDAWVGVALRAALNVALYDDTFNPDNDRDGPWQETWFPRRLPHPRTRVLIGAAAAGREAVVLERRDLGALGPSRRAMRVGAQPRVDRGARVLPGPRLGIVWTRRFAGPADAQRSVRRRPVGLGKLWACVSEGGSRSAALRMPHGVSNWADPPQRVATHPRHEGTLSGAFGARVFPGGGFLAEPTPEEIAEHSNALGRKPRSTPSLPGKSTSAKSRRRRSAGNLAGSITPFNGAAIIPASARTTMASSARRRAKSATRLQARSSFRAGSRKDCACDSDCSRFRFA